MANPPKDPIFRKFAHGIRDVGTGNFFPYKVRTLTTGQSLPRRQNVRYYIETVSFTIAALVTDAGTSAVLTGTQDLASVTLAELRKTTLVAGQHDHTYHVGVLLDVEKTVDFTAADITTAAAVVRYCEVDSIAVDA